MAKKKKNKKSSFKGKVKGDGARKDSGGGIKYLSLPKDISLYTPTPGKSEKFDIVPYTITDKNHPDMHAESETAIAGDIWYKRPFKIHKDVGADNEKFVCLSSIGKKCPICEYAKELSDEGADWDEIKAFKAKDRVLYAVIPRGVKKLEEEIHIMDFSYHMFQKLLDQEVNENDKYEEFPDVEDGLTLKVRWNEEEFGKFTYAKANRIDFEEREEELDAEIVEEAPCLDELLVVLSYKDLKAKFNEELPEDGDEEEEDEDENPFKGKKKSSKKKPVEEEEEEEEDADEGLDWGGLSKMDEDAIIELIDDEDLEVDADDYEDDLKGLQKAVAEELEIEIPKKKKPSKKKPVKEVKKAKLDWSDLADMAIMELVDVINDEDIDIDADDYETAKELATAIAEELEIEILKKRRKKN